ncbi:MAG: hypothetical protein PHH54_06690 [Candidatus Nanoarchaeia archaeon]|nr:hypothetical protein [Candidatus Nanoarchaeia archaeon]MDD5741642.1 hypothetical protein [Candidatus Nanoarchaeia archaeon]
MSESWSKISNGVETNIRVAGYIAPSDTDQILDLYKKMVVLPDIESADTTLAIGEVKNHGNLIRLIDDFKCSEGQDIGGTCSSWKTQGIINFKPALK